MKLNTIQVVLLYGWLLRGGDGDSQWFQRVSGSPVATAASSGFHIRFDRTLKKGAPTSLNYLPRRQSDDKLLTGPIWTFSLMWKIPLYSCGDDVFLVISSSRVLWFTFGQLKHFVFTVLLWSWRALSTQRYIWFHLNLVQCILFYRCVKV